MPRRSIAVEDTDYSLCFRAFVVDKDGGWFTKEELNAAVVSEKTVLTSWLDYHTKAGNLEKRELENGVNEYHLIKDMSIREARYGQLSNAVFECLRNAHGSVPRDRIEHDVSLIIGFIPLKGSINNILAIWKKSGHIRKCFDGWLLEPWVTERPVSTYV